MSVAGQLRSPNVDASPPAAPRHDRSAAAPDRRPDRTGRRPATTERPDDSRRIGDAGRPLAACSIAGITRRRVGWAAAGARRGVDRHRLRPPGRATPPRPPAGPTQLADDNAALAAEVAVPPERGRPDRPAGVRRPARPGPTGSAPATRSRSRSIRRCRAPVDGAPGSAAVRLGAEADAPDAARVVAVAPVRTRRLTRSAAAVAAADLIPDRGPCRARRRPARAAHRILEPRHRPGRASGVEGQDDRRPGRGSVFVVCTLDRRRSAADHRPRRRHPRRRPRRAQHRLRHRRRVADAAAARRSSRCSASAACSRPRSSTSTAARRRSSATVFGVVGFGHRLRAVHASSAASEGSKPFSTSTSSAGRRSSRSASRPAGSAASSSRPRARPTSSAPRRRSRRSPAGTTVTVTATAGTGLVVGRDAGPIVASAGRPSRRERPTVPDILDFVGRRRARRSSCRSSSSSCSSRTSAAATRSPARTRR